MARQYLSNFSTPIRRSYIQCTFVGDQCKRPDYTQGIFENIECSKKLHLGRNCHATNSDYAKHRHCCAHKTGYIILKVPFGDRARNILLQREIISQDTMSFRKLTKGRNFLSLLAILNVLAEGDQST